MSRSLLERDRTRQEPRVRIRYNSVPPIEISEASQHAERDAFIKFPWRIYKNDPAWVPPLILERKAFLDRKQHPFYRHGDAALFLARRNGEIVGRIMASDDPNYNSLHQTNVGCFGLFDCIDDREVAAALFDAGCQLASRARSERDHGTDRLLDELRLRIADRRLSNIRRLS